MRAAGGTAGAAPPWRLPSLVDAVVDRVRLAKTGSKNCATLKNAVGDRADKAPSLLRRLMRRLVFAVHQARLGGRHLGEAGEAEQHRRNGEIADRHRRRLGEADLLAVNEAEVIRENRAGEREHSRFVELGAR